MIYFSSAILFDFLTINLIHRVRIEALRLISTTKATLGFESEVFEPHGIELTTGFGFLGIVFAAALLATINNIDCSSEIRSNVSLLVNFVGLEEARDDVVHAGLGALRRHIEPDATHHGQASVCYQLIRVV